MRCIVRKWLRAGIAATLTAGACFLGTGIIEAANTYDMTSSQYKDGITWTDPTWSDPIASGTSSDPTIYEYRYNAATGTVEGGDVNVASNRNNISFEMRLQVKASDLPDMNKETVNKVVTQLVEKYNVPKVRVEIPPGWSIPFTYDYERNNANVAIVDDQGKVLRGYHITFTDPATKEKVDHGHGYVGGMNAAVYQNTYHNNTEEDYPLKGDVLTGSVSFDIDTSKKTDDNVYAILHPDEGATIGFDDMGASSSKVFGSIDASNQPDSKAYGVLVDKPNTTVNLGGQPTYQVPFGEQKYGEFDVKGDTATGVYAGNEGNGTSTVNFTMNKLFNVEGNHTVGLEAGHNGVISSRRNDQVSSENGYALYAHDGGQINLADITLLKSGSTAIRAENGGQVNVSYYLRNMTGNVETDNDPNSKITLAAITGNATGDLIGNVSARIGVGTSAASQATTWTGNNRSTNALTIGKAAVWNGDSLTDGAEIHVGDGGTWNIVSSTGNTHVGTFQGSTTVGFDGYVGMGDNNLSIDKYSGNTTFIYQHDENNPADVKGGRVLITSSSPVETHSDGVGHNADVVKYIPSTVALTTSSAGIDFSNESQVTSVLNALAKKINYANYTKGERGLSGSVEITEGLTTNSVVRALGDLVFDEKTGDATATKGITPFSQVMTGDINSDTAYASYWDADAKTYNFDQDVNIVRRSSNGNIPAGQLQIGNVFQGLVTNFGDQWENPMRYQRHRWSPPEYKVNPVDGPSYTINLNGHNMAVDMEGFPEPGVTGSQPMWTSAAIMAGREGTITIDNPGKIDLTCNVNFYYGSAIRVSTDGKTPTGAHVVINNDQGNLKDHVVTMRGGQGVGGYDVNFRMIETRANDKDDPVENYKYNNSVDIKGLVDIETVDSSTPVFARGGRISLGGGRISSPSGYASIWQSIGGRVDVNMNVDENGNVLGANTNPVEIDNHILLYTPWYGAGGTLNLGLTTADSYLKGGIGISQDPTYESHTNVWLQNDATWYNGAHSFKAWDSGSDDTIMSDIVSTATTLHGGKSQETAGNIVQSSQYDLTIGKLDGYVNIFMNHAADNPADFTADGNIIISSADKTGNDKAHVRLITSSVALGDMANADTVKTVLNSLANKLYYTAAASGEDNLDGTVEIAEGLTSKAFSYRIGDIAFTGDKGQGSLAGEAKAQYPDSQVASEMSEAITNEGASEEYYKQQGILKDAGYIFADDKSPTTITVTGKSTTIGGKDAVAAVAATDKDIHISGTGSTLNFNSTGNLDQQAAGVYATGGKTVTINAKAVNITADNTNRAAGEEVAAPAAAKKVMRLKANALAVNEAEPAKGEANALVADNGTIIINGDGVGTTTVKGDMKSVNKGTLTVNATAAGSRLEGNTVGDSDVNLAVGRGSSWTGASENAATSVDLSGTWTQTGDSTVKDLKGQGGTLDKTRADAGATSIDHMAGRLNIAYAHDSYQPSTVYGGDTTIKSADEGSTVNVTTDSTGLDFSNNISARQTVYASMNALAGKLHYEGGDQNLTGNVVISEGLTTPGLALRSGKINFAADSADGAGSFDYTSADDNTIDNEFDHFSDRYETQLMSATKSAMLGSAIMWRNNNNDLSRRLGDLRLGRGDNGVWARYIGGKNSYDKSNSYLRQTYNIGQVGYDKKLGKWTVGAALDYGTGKEHLRAGRGDQRQYTLGLYGSRVSDDGRYFDVIVKTGRVKNEFRAHNEFGGRLDADYHTWGTSLSMEYGKRFVRDSGFYLDPSVELTVGRLDSKHYRINSNIGSMDVNQHAFDTAIGRVGFSIGRQLPKSTLFGKLALAHEFAGDFKTGYTANGVSQETKLDLSDTWLEMELGGSLSLNKNTYLYGNFTRSFESDLTTNWRVDAGVRFTF